MGVMLALRLNMTNVADPGACHAERYQAALDMAAYADDLGFTGISCEEHHLAATGWLPSPLILAAAIAARTRKARISVNALLVPLYDPLRLAEDIAVLDNVACGRFSFVAGIGYRPQEYAAAGKDWSARGPLMDYSLEVMLKAWGDEPFRYKGELVNVTPKPRTKPHPFFFIGGMSAAAARRAARFGLPFSPPMEMPEIEAVYAEELQRCGNTGFVYRPENGSRITLLSEDPEAAWQSYGPFILNETTEYCSWRRAGVPRPNEIPADSVDQLRGLGNVEILTPQKLIDQIAGGRREVVLNPLMGGLPLQDGWSSLRLLAEKVLPEVAGMPVLRDEA
jgi:alkanesulfonate monooxygenase SsuD/methylene tetrahydromethanopterin reductase-like flavin-dependent oxidoreductase (luciferase family)